MTVPASPPSAAADGSRIRQRLTELGLELPSVAAPVAAYVPSSRRAGCSTYRASCRSWTAGS